MRNFNPKDLQKLYKPLSFTHKGQNGKLLIIGGSHLFHAASLWSLEVASRIADMVFYSSIKQNNEIVKELKKEFRNGIIVPRNRIKDYINEADCILIGPGLPRKKGEEKGDDDTGKLSTNLLKKYPLKKWVIDGGSLQTIDSKVIPSNAVLTPHKKEFEKLFRVEANKDNVMLMSKKYNCVILLKGQTDIVCSPKACVEIKGGNAGMTKGGTGDVLAGLVAGLNCKNEPFLSACVGSFVNKAAGDNLYKKVGPYFNASDLANEIPLVMQRLILKSS